MVISAVITLLVYDSLIFTGLLNSIKTGQFEDNFSLFMFYSLIIFMGILIVFLFLVVDITIDIKSSIENSG